MKTYTKLAIAAAATLVVAFAGLQLLPGGNGPGGPPTATPITTASPTSTLDTQPAFLPTSGGTIAPGRYRFALADVVTVEVPAGWTGSWPGMCTPDEGTEICWGPALGSTTRVTVAYADACRPEGTLEPVGSTPDDLVRALDAQLGTDAVITETEMGGRSASRIHLAEAAGLDRSTCQFGVDGPLQIWSDPSRQNYFALPPGTEGIVWVVDVDGARVVFQAAVAAQAPATHRAELDAMVQSIEFGR